MNAQFKVVVVNVNYISMEILPCAVLMDSYITHIAIKNKAYTFNLEAN